MNNGTKLIETDRLILRKFKLSDANDMFNNWANDERVTKYLSWKAHENSNVTEELIRMWISDYSNNTYNWAIELKEINQVIGSISVVNLDELNKTCEIGYCIGSKYWNKGIVTEAFKAVIDYLFKETEINRICAKHDIENIGSGKVMKKCNMKYEGTLREVQYRNNRFCSLSIYSILRNEFKIETF